MARISTANAAKRLGITPRQVARLCQQGKLDAIRPHNTGWYQISLPEKPKPETADR